MKLNDDNAAVIMNIYTGEINEFPADEMSAKDEESGNTMIDIAADNGYIVEMSSYPKKTCKHCHGRGYTGWRAKRTMINPCRCVFRKHFKGTINEPEEEATTIECESA